MDDISPIIHISSTNCLLVPVATVLAEITNNYNEHQSARCICIMDNTDHIILPLIMFAQYYIVANFPSIFAAIDWWYNIHLTRA